MFIQYCDQVRTFFRSSSQTTRAPSLSHLKTHWVVAADSPERDFAIKSKHSSGKARCSSNGTLVTHDCLISSANYIEFFIRKYTMSFWPDDLETRQGLFTFFEAGEYLVESFCPLCLEFKNLVILVSSSALSNRLKLFIFGLLRSFSNLQFQLVSQKNLAMTADWKMTFVFFMGFGSSDVPWPLASHPPHP